MRKLFLFVLISLVLGDVVSAATSPFETAVWIPYWRKDEGATSTLANLDKVTQISPFAYELQVDGTLKNALKANEEPWPSLIAAAKKKKIKIYPTILSYPQTSTEQYDVYLLMAQRAKRYKLEADIVALVKKNSYDGIDIDLENKPAEIKPYFSAFLSELGITLRKSGKKLICTVEARTPPESKYATTSKEILSRVEYANDYKAIGKACDQVRIMAYDQGADDANLVNQNKVIGNVYKPVADIDWVEKIMTLALEDIPAKKLLIGVPTYGYKYEIIPAEGTSSPKYPRVGSMNFNYITELINMLHATPTRNSAGELSFTYATTTGVEGEYLGGWKQYLIWYSDAQAIADKIRLAKLYKLAGIAVFKIDGGQDPNLWGVLGKK
jgi:spore germination protein